MACKLDRRANCHAPAGVCNLNSDGGEGRCLPRYMAKGTLAGILLLQLYSHLCSTATRHISIALRKPAEKALKPAISICDQPACGGWRAARRQPHARILV